MIRVFEPRLTFQNKLDVFFALNKNQISGTSKPISDFEETSKKYFDREYGVALSNGSTALEVALKLLNLKENDEVILPSFTIVSCLAAVIRTGATPVFCDVDKESWNMSLSDIKKVKTKNTKAVIMVHTYGLTANAVEISEFCNSNNIYLIEDAAEAHGQIIDEKKCGSFGDISVMSFYANKHITSGEGGMLLTNSKDYYEKALSIRNLGFNPDERFKHENLYWNYRMSGIQASLGTSQFKNLNKTISQKIEQGRYYLELLSELQNDIQLPLLRNDVSINHFWVFGIVLKQDNIRDSVTKKLIKSGIETRPFFWPLHMQPLLQKYNYQINSDIIQNSKYLGSNGFYIPIGPHVSKKNQRFIFEEIKKSLKES
jgi:perosamine synthetase